MEKQNYKNCDFFSFDGTEQLAYVVKVYDGDTFTCAFEVAGKPYKFNCR